MRLMIYQLNPRILEQEGFGIALRRRLDSVENRAGIKTYLTIPENIHLPAEIEESLYHIAQEALNNALKHSRESEVHISLTRSDRKNNGEVVILEIQDNGEGFSEESADLSGMGLTNMKHRAEEHKGTFSLISNPGEGTTVRVEIPLPAQ
jgi:signal transduction histidine kinase